MTAKLLKSLFTLLVLTSLFVPIAQAASTTARQAQADHSLIYTEQKISASDGAANDAFGWSVAISGDTAVVGVTSDDIGPNSDQGSAYVFVRSGTTWTYQAKLTASDGAAGDGFGVSVAILGDVTLIGAYRDDISSSSDRGSAYIFMRSGTTWTEEIKLTASDGAADDNFGYSVALSGSTALVGAYSDDIGGASDQGSAYVFTLYGTTWSQQQKLVASDGLAGDIFGTSVALSGETAVVGAARDDINTNTDQGSAYIFTRSGTNWTQQAKLTASDGAADDQFGRSVALSGDSALVGAYYADLPSLANTGAAYVFTRSGTSWSQQAILTASDANVNDNFGISVAISGNTALVGAYLDDRDGLNPDQGSAYIYTRSGTTWTQQDKLTASDGAGGAWFGGSVSLSGDSALIGASADDIGANANQGSSYFYTFDLPPTVVSITRAGANPTGASSIDFNVIFSQAVTGVDPSDFTLTAGGSISSVSISTVSGSGASYTVTISTGTGDGTLRLDIPGTATITDTDVNPLTNLPYTSGEVYEVDKAPAVISITRLSANPTKAASVSYTVTFSEAVTGVDSGDFTLSTGGTITGASVGGVSGTGASYTVDAYTGNGDGTLRLDVSNTATITDLTGHSPSNLPYTAGEVYDVDKTAPSVSSITRLSPNPTNAASVDFMVTFSEAVTGVDAADFSITQAGSSGGASVTTVNGSGATRSVTVNTGWGVGTLRLDISFNATIVDQCSTQLTGLPFTGGQAYDIDKNPPNVSTINRLDPNPTAASSVNFIVTFSEAVTGVDMSDFALTTSGTLSGVSVTGLSGSGASYTVTASTGSGDGSLRLDVPNTATVYDLLTNPLGGLPWTYGQSYTVDKTAPGVLSINRLSANPTSASSVSFTVTFSEAVIGVDTGDFSLTTSGTLSGASVTGVSGSGATRTVAVNTGSGGGTLRLDIPNTASIADQMGYPLSGLPYTGGQAYDLDRTAPTVVSITRLDPNPTSASSISFLVTFSEPVTGVHKSYFSLTKTGSLSGVSVTGVSGSGASYTVTVSTGTGDGTLRLDISGSPSIFDLANNRLSGLPYTSGETYTIMIKIYLPLVFKTP